MTPNMPWKKEECTYGLRGPLECYGTILDSFWPQLREKKMLLFFFPWKVMFDYRGLHLCKVGNMSEGKKRKLTFDSSNNSHFA